MGITDKSIKRLQPHLYQGVTMLQIGCQNLYFHPEYGNIAHQYFNNRGYNTVTIDITGCQGAAIVDLRQNHDLGKFDIVTDFGCMEHLDGGVFEFNRNIHNACKVGGIMIRENPLTGNWPQHGVNYIDTEFYRLLADAAGYEILELTTEAAMGNTTDGWNVAVVLRKLTDNEFISREMFNAIGHVFAK